jgi:hypothetical protein
MRNASQHNIAQTCPETKLWNRARRSSLSLCSCCTIWNIHEFRCCVTDKNSAVDHSVISFHLLWLCSSHCYHILSLVKSHRVLLRARVACLQTLGRPHVRPMRPPWTDAHRHTLAQTKIAKFDVECILRAKTLTGMGRWTDPRKYQELPSP